MVKAGVSGTRNVLFMISRLWVQTPVESILWWVEGGRWITHDKYWIFFSQWHCGNRVVTVICTFISSSSLTLVYTCALLFRTKDSGIFVSWCRCKIRAYCVYTKLQIIMNGILILKTAFLQEALAIRTKKMKLCKMLTLKVLVTTIDAQWEGMGDVRSARYELALLPPCPTIRVLSYSN